MSNSGVKKLPVMLILKRRAIRIFPNNITVGLYHSQQLDKWVTVPSADIGLTEEMQKEISLIIENLEKQDKEIIND